MKWTTMLLLCIDALKHGVCCYVHQEEDGEIEGSDRTKEHTP